MSHIAFDAVIFALQRRGGVSRIFHELIPRLLDLDAELDATLLLDARLLGPAPQHPRLRRRSLGTLGRLGLWQPRRYGIRRAAVARALGRRRRDVWHSTYFSRPLAWRGAEVVTVYDMIYERYPDLFAGVHDRAVRRAKRAAIMSADAVICISEATRHDVVEHYGLDASRTHVAPLAASDRFRKLESPRTSAAEEPFLLYLGSRAHYKNFGGLVRVYSEWPAAAEIRLVVAGGGPWTIDEIELLADLRLEDRVSLLPDVDDTTLCRLYNRAAAFVYPSLYEGFGIPVLEAMRCGCPVVASSIPATLEVAGDWLFLFDPGDRASFADALTRAVERGRNEDRQVRAIERARRFSWNETAKATLRVYQSVSS